jgi:hypothetical protein
LYDYGASLFEKALADHREAVEAALPTIRTARNMTPLESRCYWMSSIARAVFCRAHALI